MEFQGPAPRSCLILGMFGKPNIWKFFGDLLRAEVSDHGVRRKCRPRQQGYS